MSEFDFDAWFEDIEFSTDEARDSVGDWLRNEEVVTRNAILGLDLEKDFPKGFRLGWKTLLRTAVQNLRAMDSK